MSPFEKFYTDSETSERIIRLYGVLDDGIHYGGVSGHIGWTNDVIGIHHDDLKKLDKWEPQHLEKIRLTNAPELFLIPDGWYGFVNH